MLRAARHSDTMSCLEWDEARQLKEDCARNQIILSTECLETDARSPMSYISNNMGD